MRLNLIVTIEKAGNLLTGLGISVKNIEQSDWIKAKGKKLMFIYFS